MSVKFGDVDTFPGVTPSKAQVLKVVGESAEVFAAWRDWHADPSAGKADFVLYECADVVQAIANLVASMGVVDMTPSIEMCRRVNEARGRFKDVRHE